MKQITQEDLSAVRVLRTTLSEIVNAIGELHLNKLILNAQLKQLDVEISQQEYKFEEFQNNERVLYETLQQKYGTGTINIETGEVTE